MKTWIWVPSTRESLRGAASSFTPRRTLETRWPGGQAQSVSYRFSQRSRSKNWGRGKTLDSNLWPPVVHTDLTHKCTYTPMCTWAHPQICVSIQVLSFALLPLTCTVSSERPSCSLLLLQTLVVSTASGLLDYCSYSFLIIPGNFLLYARHCG